MRREISYGEKYDPAMKITDPEEARRYFELLVEHSMSFGNTREEAERIERDNLGYWAGYYDHKTRLRVEKLFDCVHPVIGRATEPKTPEEIFQIGLRMGERLRGRLRRGKD